METKMYFLGTRKSDKCKNRAWAGWLDIENEIVREERFNLDSDRQDGLFWDRCGLKSMMRYRVDYSWKKQGDGKFFAIDVGDELYTDDLDDVLDKMPDLKNKNILGKFDCWKKRDLDREAKRNERKAAKRKKSDASCDDEDDRPFTKEELHRMNKRMESIGRATISFVLTKPIIVSILVKVRTEKIPNAGNWRKYLHRSVTPCCF